jgi:thiamine biosynthesis lipoprotein
MTGDGPAVEVPRRAVVEHVMGLPVSVHARGGAARSEPVEAAIRAGMAELHVVDEVFSTWRPDSAINRLRRSELPLVDCPPEVADVLELCERAGRRTGGWFDHLLDDGHGLRRIDPTGLVKGWAVDRALAIILARLEVEGLDEIDVAVNAGGDVALHSAVRGGRSWQAGVEDPADRTRIVATLPIGRGGIATSGNAARGTHIIDPFTGDPVDRPGSVTIYGPTLMWADVLATAAFAYGDDCARWLVTLPGWSDEGWGAVVVTSSGTVAQLFPGES